MHQLVANAVVGKTIKSFVSDDKDSALITFTDGSDLLIHFATTSGALSIDFKVHEDDALYAISSIVVGDIV